MHQFPVYTAPQIQQAVGIADLIEPVAEAFQAFSAAADAKAPVMVLPLEDGGDSHIKAAGLTGRRNFVVKVGNWFPNNAARGLPEGGGFVALFDATTGRVTAILDDEHYLSDIRTAAAGAVGARALARVDATRAVVMGTGRQAYLQALALTHVRPIEQITVWGRDPSKAERLAGRLRQDLPDVEASATTDADRALRQADIIVTATASSTPVLRGEWLIPGQHVTAVGADDPTKRELDGACLSRATGVFVDSRELSLRYGDMHAAIDSAEVTADRIDGELGDVLAGRVPGRCGTDDITIAKLIGIGHQDLVAAETALDRLEVQKRPENVQ